MRRLRGLQSPPSRVRILADTNIVAPAVRSLRDAGHDVVYAAEFAVDPGDESLLAQAVRENRVFLTKDHDIGALVYRDSRTHCGVLLVDDLGAAAAETQWRTWKAGKFGAQRPRGGPHGAGEIFSPHRLERVDVGSTP